MYDFVLNRPMKTVNPFRNLRNRNLIAREASDRSGQYPGTDASGSAVRALLPHQTVLVLQTANRALAGRGDSG